MSLAIKNAPRLLLQLSRQTELLLRRDGLTASTCGAVRFQVSHESGKVEVQRDGAALKVSNQVTKTLEQLLANNRGKPLVIDGVNVQLAGQSSAAPLQLQIIDFGRYRFAEHFDHQLYAWIDADYQNLNGLHLTPDHPFYIQPDPLLSLAKVVEGTAFAARQQHVRNFRQTHGPDNLCRLCAPSYKPAGPCIPELTAEPYRKVNSGSAYRAFASLTASGANSLALRSRRRWSRGSAHFATSALAASRRTRASRKPISG
ncbi:hypothetical protein ACQ9Y2_10155 [Pseudomonas palleroniana]